ncbi:hypothetical protein EJ110_NYTH59721 [Nymphaea thermarum]|nr:hypothetical protein EJ110_NYTH59721 [Nymphaea thermarum]
MPLFTTTLFTTHRPPLEPPSGSACASTRRLLLSLAPPAPPSGSACASASFFLSGSACTSARRLICATSLCLCPTPLSLCLCWTQLRPTSSLSLLDPAPPDVFSVGPSSARRFVPPRLLPLASVLLQRPSVLLRRPSASLLDPAPPDGLFLPDCCRQPLFCSGDPLCCSGDPLFLLSPSHRLISMAASSSSTVNQTEIGGIRTENVPMQVINLRLTKENYFSWSPAMTMGIAARDRMTYIDGSNPEPARTSGVWRTWFLEDNQVKTWIVNYVSLEIQPLILRKKTARDMWVVLEQMYGHNKMDIRTYQVMKTVYNLRQGSSSVAEYYGALKAK